MDNDERLTIEPVLFEQQTTKSQIENQYKFLLIRLNPKKQQRQEEEEEKEKKKNYTKAEYFI